jgi:hypothetical protein
VKNFVWLIVGVGIGFVFAHHMNKTQQGKQFFEEIDRRSREFGQAVTDSYREREAELRAEADRADEVIADLGNK